jgi:large subunit ribosomal protein L10
MAEENKFREKPIPEYKKKLVEELAKKMKESKTILIASTNGLPSSQFHEIKKKLRGKAEIKVAKKSAVTRAMDATEKGSLIKLKESVGADIALFFSEEDTFALSGLLSDNQSPARAKAGDLAPEDIEVEPGPTELIPGPAISELSGVGLKVAVEDGKLAIKQGAVIVKEGEEISEGVASVMGKLDITPMRVGFEPIAAYDANSDMVYVGIKIDKPGTLESMREAIAKSLNLSVNIGLVNSKTIGYFIAKAGLEGEALSKKVTTSSGSNSPEEGEEEESEGERKEEDVKEEEPKAEEKAEEEKKEKEVKEDVKDNNDKEESK